MQEALHYLDTVEIHASDFDCDIHCGRDSPAAADGEVPTGLKPTFSADHGSAEYWLQPPLSERPTIESVHISSIPFWHSTMAPQVKTKMMSKVHEEDFGDNYQASQQQMDKQQDNSQNTCKIKGTKDICLVFWCQTERTLGT